MLPARFIRRAALVPAALALAVWSGAGTGEARAQAANDPASVGTPDGLVRWMAAHPANAGLVVLPDRGAASLSFGARQRFPLASTRKVLVVGALAASGERLTTRVPRASVERYYVPGTDAGAHLRAKLDPARPTLAQLARAAIEVSDNASADALLERVGRSAVDAWAHRQGLARQDPIYPLLGEFAAWTRDPGWTGRSPAGRARRAQALTRQLLPSAVQLPAPAEQRRLVRSSVAGVPSEWAALMRRIGRRGNRSLVHVLDWPRRQDPAIGRRFSRLLTKGGSLPGTITEASYVRRRGRTGAGVALFLRDLPADVEATLQRTFTQQQLILRLASDRSFLARSRAVLARAES